MSQPEYREEVDFCSVTLCPVDESALDLDFVSETAMWEWYGNIMAALGTITIEMAHDKPEEFRFPYLKVPFIYDLSEMGE